MRCLFLCLILWPALATADGPLTVIDEGGWQRCEAVGELAALLQSPACALDFDACTVAVDTIRGKADHGDLFTQLIARGESGWTAACPGDGPRFLHQTALKGLGYLGRAEHLDALVALAPVAAQIGENARRLLAEALYWIDDPQAAPALVQMLQADVVWPDFKLPALAALARWGEPGAVEWCSTRLGPATPDAVGAACVHYLAAVRPEGVRGLLEGALANHGLAAVRALGRLGDKAAVPAVLRWTLATKTTEARVAAWVTLVQLGEDKYLGRIIKALKGPAKIRADRLAKAKKRSARRRKRRKRSRRRRWRRRKRRKPKRPNKWARKRLMKMLSSLDLAHHVAMEVTRLERADLKARIDRALWSAAKSTFELRWKAHTYALLALAQRGDAAATAKVVTLLAEGTEPIRRAVVATAGGRGWDFTRSVPTHGTGLIPDRALYEALLVAADDCDTHAQRSAALYAALQIRRAL